jgi:plastocyanin
MRRQALAASIVLTVVAILAGGSIAGTKSPAAVIKAVDGGKMVPNKYIQDEMHFAPGTINVKSGQSITFTFADRKQMDPHTLTIVKKSELPRTVAQVDTCNACETRASGHLKNPKAPPGPANGIVHWLLNVGQPGLDAPGDSVAIQQPGAHRSVTVVVSAPAGTTLYFLCAVHPWMQGKIVVH